jgi:hypothetical protein
LNSEALITRDMAAAFDMTIVIDYGHIAFSQGGHNGVPGTGSAAVPPSYAWTFT